MVDLAWGIVAVLSIGWGVLAYEWWGLPRRRTRVIVTFRDEKAPSLEAILWQRRGRWLVFRDCYLLEAAKQAPTRLDGEVTLDRAQVLFLQMPGDAKR